MKALHGWGRGTSLSPLSHLSQPSPTCAVLTSKVTREDKDEGEDEEKGHICLQDP